MPYLLNLIYLFVLLLFSPWLIYKSLTTGKYRRGLWTKLTGRIRARHAASVKRKRVVWFHGVSVGEIHLLRQVVAAYRRRHPDDQCVVSTTTDTGQGEAVKAFPDLPIIYWPLDFTWAVKTALDRVRPDLVVLAEGEIWPNFVRLASARGIKIAVVNGRMSPRSAARYRKLAWLPRATFARLAGCAVQTEEHAAGFRLAGAKNVIVTGNVKYDGAATDRRNPRTQHLRNLFSIDPNELVWVAGSTQDPEEDIVLNIFRRVGEKHPNLRLIIVPRQKERFQPVADLLAVSGVPFLRRSELTHPVTPTPHHPVIPTSPHPVILVDTFGELSAVWGLADIAFVGGSLDGGRGGQNMIEPAAYGAAVVFGPYTWNFKDTVTRLLDGQAAIQAANAADLKETVVRLLADRAGREKLGERARTLVASQHGATERTLDVLDSLFLDALISNSPIPESKKSLLRGNQAVGYNRVGKHI
ncbi:MAG: 3-deoxy-D-manno-octulosonic acid transferase [Planctomycetes bacterium]|nr:3-deoxy-D-manno-octulosonic acid transferase [Planctomycetota bacterium]